MTDDSIVDLVKKHQGDIETVPLADDDSTALKRKAEMMSANLPEDKVTDELLESLLKNVKSKMSWVEIELPSQGLLYKDGVKTNSN